MSIAGYGQRVRPQKKAGAFPIKEYVIVACLPCNLPHAFSFRVSDKETIFHVAGCDVFGNFNFAYVDFRIETERFPVLVDTNCMLRSGISTSAENADLLSEHRNSLHLPILV